MTIDPSKHVPSLTMRPPLISVLIAIQNILNRGVINLTIRSLTIRCRCGLFVILYVACASDKFIELIDCRKTLERLRSLTQNMLNLWD